MNTTERLIIQKLQNGEQEAYRYLYAHHYVILCQFANELIKDSFLAETIVEDLILHLWEVRSSLEIKTSLRSYLLKAVRNRCYNYLSSEKEKKEVYLSKIETDTPFFDNLVQTNDHPLGKLLELELENEIRKSINQLSNEAKLVFQKSRFENKKNEEIAQELGISVNTVKYHIKKAIAQLHQDLGEYLIILLSFLSLPN